MRQRRYQLLVVTGLLMILAALFCTSPNSAIDIQIHDTYLVFSSVQLYQLLAGFSWGIWGIYWLVKNRLRSQKLARVHIGGTVIALLILAFCFYVTDNYGSGSMRRGEYDVTDASTYEAVRQRIQLLFLVSFGFLMFFQLLLPINILAEVFRKRR